MISVQTLARSVHSLHLQTVRSGATPGGERLGTVGPAGVLVGSYQKEQFVAIAAPGQQDCLQ